MNLFMYTEDCEATTEKARKAGARYPSSICMLHMSHASELPRLADCREMLIAACQPWLLSATPRYIV